MPCCACASLFWHLNARKAEAFWKLRIRISRLTHGVRYRPYKSFSMQLLSSFSACALVAICGLLLRSQSLLSAARSPNFEANDPSSESSSVSTELIPIIVLLITLLAAPAVLAIILAIMKRFQSRKADSQLSSSTKVSADQAPPAVVEQHSDLCAKEATNLAQNFPVQLVPEVFSSVMSNESESVPHANPNDPFIRSMNWKCSPSAEEAKTWNAPDELSSTQPTSQCSDGVLSILENSMTAVKGNSITPRLPDPDGALSISCAALPSFLVRERIEIAQKRQYLAEAVAAGLGGSKTIFASIPMPAFLPDPDDGPCAITDSDRLRVSRS